MKLDVLDIKILAALQREGRITKLRLAEEVALSPSACFERVRRLEQAGYIRGYHAVIDLARLIQTCTIFVEVTLRTHEAGDFERFESAIVKVPEVVECFAIGGGMDYVLKVVTLNIEHYQRLIDELLAAEIGIERDFAYIVTKPVKSAHEMPIHYLLERTTPQ
jgi:Lrp/AsnC family transcriptional regulator of ectoine degradation